ncbi:MAG: VOC family protein [Dehalococcoidia bacterium]|nr:VOC family protein [Dehalococcoidia bacterium]
MNPPAPGAGLPRLHEVTITTARPEVAVRTFEALFGHAAEQDSASATFATGQSLVRVVRSENPRGIDGIRLVVQSSQGRATALARAGVRTEHHDGHIIVPREQASGMEVTFVDDHQHPRVLSPSGVALDHLAIAVRDLAAGVARWTGILGVEVSERGPHPLGGITMARFLLGPQMIELVSPAPGVESATQRRLEKRGDGPITLALIPSHLPAATERLRAAGTLLVEQPPHTFIHPSDSGGVLVQLTPRLEHSH